MYKRLATVTGVLAIIAAAVLATGRAEAGASASAPSKYSNRSQVATADQMRRDQLAQRRNFPITEYSSSSAKNPSHRHYRH
jgi:hypothetical protein